MGYVHDASAHVANGRPESPALAGLCASVGVARIAPAEEQERVYRAERAWQSRWIAATLGLDEPTDPVLPSVSTPALVRLPDRVCRPRHGRATGAPGDTLPGDAGRGDFRSGAGARGRGRRPR